MNKYMRIILHTMIVVCISCLLFSVKANAAKVKSISFQKYEDTLTIKKGETLKLKVSISPKKAKNKRLKWSSSNNKIVTVTSKGVIKGKKRGKATIVVKTTDGSRKKLKLKVIVGTKVSKVDFQNDEQLTELEVGKSYKLEVKVSPLMASNKKIKWSTSDESVATVNSQGMVTGKASGNTVITAEAADGSGKKVSREIQVVSLVKSLTLFLKTNTAYCTALNVNGAYVKKGYTFPLQVNIEPSDALNRKLLWRSSNMNVAKVSQTGEVTAVGCGVAAITALTTDGSKKDVFMVYVGQLEKSSCKFIAHRGRSEIAPENSLSAIRLALQSNFDYVEFDIWKTADDKFVVSHDESLKRSCGVDVKVTSLSLAQAKKYRIINGSNITSYPNEYISSLEQVLVLAKNYPGKTLCIELKQVMSKDILVKLLETVQSYGLWNRVKLITFHKQNIVTIRTLSDMGGDAVMMEYLSDAPNAETINTCIKYHAGLGSNYGGLTEQQVALLHKNGIEVNVWNIPDFITAYHMIYTMKVDAVTTDYQFFE